METVIESMSSYQGLMLFQRQHTEQTCGYALLMGNLLQNATSIAL